MAKKDELQPEELANGFDAKAMIAENAAAKTVIRYADRKKLKIVQATRHYTEGQIINPHVVMAEALIKQGIAEEVKD